MTNKKQMAEIAKIVNKGNELLERSERDRILGSNLLNQAIFNLNKLYEDNQKDTKVDSKRPAKTN